MSVWTKHHKYCGCQRDNKAGKVFVKTHQALALRVQRYMKKRNMVASLQWYYLIKNNYLDEKQK